MLLIPYDEYLALYKVKLEFPFFLLGEWCGNRKASFSQKYLQIFIPIFIIVFNIFFDYNICFDYLSFHIKKIGLIWFLYYLFISLIGLLGFMNMSLLITENHINIIPRCLSLIGRESLDIYLMHMFFVKIIFSIIGLHELSFFISFIFTLVSIVIIHFMIKYIFSKIPFYAVMTGRIK